MRIYPAIDLLGGKVVRLRQGRRDQATVYSHDPGEVARGFVAGGAERIHVVDLDGAFEGARANAAAVEEIVRSGARVQLGGGVRDAAAVLRLLEAGVDRVVVGTLAARDPDGISGLPADLRSRVVVAVDARGGKVFVEGWDVPTGLDAVELARRVADAGVAGILYTDIARDGMGSGPNVEATARLAQAVPGTEVIASGGIGKLADLALLSAAGVEAAVVGRALYENAFTLPEALGAARRFVQRSKEGPA